MVALPRAADVLSHQPSCCWCCCCSAELLPEPCEIHGQSAGEESVTHSVTHSVTYLSDSRPQNRTWKTRTLGRQQATRIRKSLSMRRHLWQDAATAATLLLLLQQTGSLIGSLLVAGHMTRLRLKPQHKNLTCD